MAHQYNCVGTYVGHGGPVWCLAIGPDNLIFSGSADQRIRVRHAGARFAPGWKLPASLAMSPHQLHRAGPRRGTFRNIGVRRR